METELREAIVCGVFVEFCDECGNCVAQSVYLDWHDSPLPAVGDSLTCGVANAQAGRSTQFSGRVRSRHFDIQRDDAGSVCVWVRLVADLVVRASTSRKPFAPRYQPVRFSDN
jgi:hypothetical protein